MLDHERTRLSKEDLERNFADLHPAFSGDEAVTEAARCLYCYDAPCMRACPTHIDVPRFIRQILHDNPEGAGKTIFDENIFGGSCARACPTEVLCEGACVDMTLLKEPVRIGLLQRFATDAVEAAGTALYAPGSGSGRRVAVVGSGPAGLTCAHELRKRGHAVTVFESRDTPGGLNTFGIAAYKIDTAFALSEVDRVLELGIDLKLNHPVDSDELDALMVDYDAVFLGIGLGPTAELGIPGEDLSGVVESLEFVYQTHTGPLSACRVGHHVVVIGAGNTAIDVATEAVRLGADEVTIAYRRSPDVMSAFLYEYELAKADGIRFSWHVRPVSFEGDSNGHLTAVLLQPVAPASDGSLQDTDSDPVLIPCDMVVKALGQISSTRLSSTLQEVLNPKGRIVIDPETGSTSVRGLYSGGDAATGGAEIVDAVQSGKKAAVAIHNYLAV